MSALAPTDVNHRVEAAVAPRCHVFLNVINLKAAPIRLRILKGRGVVIYIKKDIEYKEINIEDSEDCNIAAIKIKKLKYKIIAIYRAPQINPEDFFENLDEILGRYKNAIIIGDINLNIPNVKNNITNYKEIIELNNYHIKNLTQKKNITRKNKQNGSILDHVIDLKELQCKINAKDTAISDHKMLHVALDINSETETKKDSYTTTKI
ncbi:hypothetical protein HHI36_004593 [Cryptolaemus montrouzieri]|uniref:Endonuclease/exonuclease/phosphatase domain-containing protein n=1 Tax=Cryptolaemus montrouzieri TaxID=559131 RepID=A0ABD2NRN0_9CUCU